jgi:two-component system, OmpR family, response regulator RegX3
MFWINIKFGAMMFIDLFFFNDRGKTMTRILLVEDDKSIVGNLTAFLQAEGFSVDSVNGQAAAIKKIYNETYDLLLVDISLPEGNGFAVCAAVKANTGIPVIFLTASGDEYSVVTGLDMGADDYIGKPFRPRELVSRIRNVLRRTGKVQPAMDIDGIHVDTVKGMVTKNGSEVFLSALEYRLLLVFLNNKGAVLSRNKLLEEIWDTAGEFVNDNTLTVYIKRLRDKIEKDPLNPAIIKTVRGLGYKVGD